MRNLRNPTRPIPQSRNRNREIHIEISARKRKTAATVPKHFIEPADMTLQLTIDMKDIVLCWISFLCFFLHLNCIVYVSYYWSVRQILMCARSRWLASAMGKYAREKVRDSFLEPKECLANTEESTPIRKNLRL